MFWSRDRSNDAGFCARNCRIASGFAGLSFFDLDRLDRVPETKEIHERDVCASHRLRLNEAMPQATRTDTTLGTSPDSIAPIA